jgi:hypothetical protein
MDDQLEALAPPLTAVTSLAIGADQLLATLVDRRGGEIYAVIPFQGYERTFRVRQQSQYRFLSSKATAKEVLSTSGTDEDAYLAAGKRVVELSDMMIAVWNGQSAKGRGGTADIVAFADRRQVPLVHINPVDRSVTRRNM